MTQRETDSADPEKLKELLIEQLKEAYWLENKLVRMLLKFQELATANNIKQIFADHSEQTRTHVSRLELVFSFLGLPTSTKACSIVSDIADSYNSIVLETRCEMSKRDVRLVQATQKAKQHEIAVYHELLRLVVLLRYSNVEPILNKTLQEEQQANDLLSGIKESVIAYKAGSPSF